MAAQLHYRAMVQSDLTTARELWSASEGVELAEGDSLDELEKFLRRNPEFSQVALVGDQLRGAVLAGHDGRRGYIYHLAVSREMRGRGVARALIERAALKLKAAGLARVLVLVAKENGGGQRFWLSQGWETLTFAEPMGRNL